MTLTLNHSLTRAEVEAFLYREARLLDDRQWDEWIVLYSPKVEYWMPAWDDDDQLVDDPQQHGLATLCIGVGQGLAVAVERV